MTRWLGGGGEVIFLSVVFLLIFLPTVWGLWVAIAEIFTWRSDKFIAKQLYKKLGQDMYRGGPLRTRVWRRFKRGCWSAFLWIIGLSTLGLILWFIFGDLE